MALEIDRRTLRRESARGAAENGGWRGAQSGWREAKGEWIAFLDHDDLFHPDKLAILAPLTEGDAEVVVSRWREIENGVQSAKAPSSRRGAAPRLVVRLEQPACFDECSSVRRSSLESVGGFDARCVPADDWDLWLCLAARQTRLWSDAVTTDYILHSGQQRRDEGGCFAPFAARSAATHAH
jgi:glycosyltransferase involved in cell wall biosynthesis